MCTDAGAGNSRRVLGEPFRFYLFPVAEPGNLRTRVNVLLRELNLQLVLEGHGMCVSVGTKYLPMCACACIHIKRYAVLLQKHESSMTMTSQN